MWHEGEKHYNDRHISEKYTRNTVEILLVKILVDADEGVHTFW